MVVVHGDYGRNLTSEAGSVMDPMFMEASLFVASDPLEVPRFGPSSQVGPIEVSSGSISVCTWVDPLVGTCSHSDKGNSVLPSHVNGPSSAKGMSYADLFKAPPVQVETIPLVPSKKGGYVSIRVDPKAYQSRLDVCKYSLIGRVVLSRGEKPCKLVDLKSKLQSIWKLSSSWRLISLGNGYFQVMLHSQADKSFVWGMGSIHLKPGILRLQPWVPDFNPASQKSTNAQVWVRFYDLSWEYWHPKIISDLARGIGVPLRLDRATIDGDSGHFARVLVDMDVSSSPPTSLLLERDDAHSSFISVEYENLPVFCSTCSSIGHLSHACRWNKSDNLAASGTGKVAPKRDGSATVAKNGGFQVPHNKSANRMEFRPVSSIQSVVPVSNVFGGTD